MISQLKNNPASISKIGDKNPMWKGDEVGYGSLHTWVTIRLQKPLICPQCGINPTRDLANISQKYKRDLDDWEWLCRKCHMEKDNRLRMFIEKNYNSKLTNEQVMEIYLSRGKTPSKILSEKFGISRDHIRHIWCGDKRRRITINLETENNKTEEEK